MPFDNDIALHMSHSNPIDVVDFLKQKGITRLYHFTDRGNVQSIIDNGGLFSWKACENKGIVIKHPGGSLTSRSIDSSKGLSNYVRLSFTKKHPMMFVAKGDGRINDPVVLEIDLSIAGLSTTKFSDRNAAKKGAIIALGYEGAKNIHYNTVKHSTHFELSPEEKEFYQAEILVLEKVPLSSILNINLLRHNPPIFTPVINRMPIGTNRRRWEKYEPSNNNHLKTRESNQETNQKAHSNYGCIILIIIYLVINLIIALFEALLT